MRVEAYPQGVFVTRNLTSDPETGLGQWTEAQIAAAIRTGRTPTRMLNIWGMPWMFLHRLRDDDALAIARYLKTLPPVRNQIRAPLHYGVVETMVAKLTCPLYLYSIVRVCEDGTSDQSYTGRHRPTPLGS